MALGAIVMAAVAGVLYLLLGRSEPIPRIGRSEQLTTEAGLEIQPSLSPDGRLVAYAAGNSARMRVFIRPVGGGRTIPLSDDSTAVETEPKWSPDGTQLLFLSRGARLGRARTRRLIPRDHSPLRPRTRSAGRPGRPMARRSRSCEGRTRY